MSFYSYPTELLTKHPEESELSSVHKITNNDDDEFTWYKPIAVILKPATQRDFQKILEDDKIDELYNSPLNQQQHRRYWPSEEGDFWGFDPEDYPAPYQQQQDRIYERHDRLRDAYSQFDLSKRVESNLLSLARMGLVVIPTKEIGRNKNEMNQEEEGNGNMKNKRWTMRSAIFFSFRCSVTKGTTSRT